MAVAEPNPGPLPHLCLKWNNYQSNLANVFDQLLQSETFVDVTLAAEGQSIKAHKLVLSACSPYFQILFNENPCPHPIIILKDTKYDDLKAVVEYMYKGEISVAQNELNSLLKVADSLRIRGLSEMETSSPTPPSPNAKKPESPHSTSAKEDQASPRPTKRRRSSGDQPSSDVPSSPSNEGISAVEVPTSSFGAVTVTPVLSSNQKEEAVLKPGIEDLIREEERAKMMDVPSPHMFPNSAASPNPNMLSDGISWRSKAPSWTKEKLQEAIMAIVTQKMRFSQAASYYNIPKGTLYDNILGKSKRMDILNTIYLNAHDEELVIDYCCDVNKMPFNRRTNRALEDVLRFVEGIKRRREPGFEFNGLTGFRWWWAFSKKHNIVSLYYSKPKEALKYDCSLNNNNYDDLMPQNLSLK